MSERAEAKDFAVVFGGGGAVGNAWTLGVVAGLLDAGLDVRDADLLVGTSSGATAAAQVVGEDPRELYERIVAAPAPGRPTGQGRPSGPRQAPAVSPLEVSQRVIDAAESPQDMRRGLGAAALELAADVDLAAANARWQETAGSRFPLREWPTSPRLAITAVDADSGEGVVFDRASGVELVDAIAASTSNGFGVPPYAIGGRRFLDGGYRRNENADVATGYARILVLSPLGGRTRMPREWRFQLDAQVEELRASGSRVDVILPDAAALEAFGPNLMDLSRRADAARAGYAQGRGSSPR